MKLNCETGDIAMLVRDTAGSVCPELMGLTYTCRDFVLSVGGPGWLLPEPIACPRCGSAIFGFLDADLQPIRGPRAETPTGEPVNVDEVAHG